MDGRRKEPAQRAAAAAAAAAAAEAADECNASLTVTLSAKCDAVTFWGSL